MKVVTDINLLEAHLFCTHKFSSRHSNTNKVTGYGLKVRVSIPGKRNFLAALPARTLRCPHKPL